MRLPVRFIVDIEADEGLVARCLDADLRLRATTLCGLEQLAADVVLRELGADRPVRLLLGGGRPVEMPVPR
jgi:hypothetical protein